MFPSYLTAIFGYIVVHDLKDTQHCDLTSDLRSALELLVYELY